MLRVLLVENAATDETASISQYLLAQGYRVDTIGDTLAASRFAIAEWPDLVVVNTCSQLSGVNEMCQTLDRVSLDLPRLIVHDGETPKHLAAEAYIALPFTLRKLSFRIKKAVGEHGDRFGRLGDIIVDRVKRVVKHQDQVAPLTPKELRLLSFLMMHPGAPLNRSLIMRNVWDTDYVGDTRTLEVHIRWLRQKVEHNPKRPEHIITVRGTGYMFRM